MKKLILLYLVFAVFSCLIYSQPASQLSNNNNPLVKGNEGILSAQCVGGLVYDDNTWENGYGFNPGFGLAKFVMKFTPDVYPYTINQICYAFTRTAAGSPNFTFDIIVYDAAGTGGGPGNVVVTIPNIVINIPIWPSTAWFDFINLTGIPALISGSYYVGFSYDPAAQPSHYICADESAITTQRQGYGYTQSAWLPIQYYYTYYKTIGVRVDGTGPIFAHNIAVGPFLSLPGVFNVGTPKVIKAKVKNLGTSNESSIPIKFLINGTQINSIMMNLNAGAVDSVSFNWTPADTGTKVLKVIASLATDQYRANDTVTTIVNVYPPGYAQSCWGTDTISAGYPFYTYYMDSRTDMLYKANEINLQYTPGIISKIGFMVKSAAPQVMNGFKIKMQNTSLTSLTGFVNTGWTEVYSGSYSLPANGLQWIHFNTPFWFAGNNLLMEICFNNSSWTANTIIASTTNAGRVFHGHQDLPSGDGCVDINTGSIQAALPNICFQGIMTGLNKEKSNIPDKFSLSQNYPNPFNPITSINYSIPKQTNVRLTIFDALGRKVAVLVNEKQSAGNYNVEWDGTNYSSGLYFYKIECDGFMDVKKLVLIK